MSNLLTASRLKDARACQRLHRLRYGEGYRPLEDAGVLRFGTMVHFGLEAWWRATGEDRLTAALEAMQSDADGFEQVRAAEMLRGYHYRWQSEQYEVLAVEAAFEAPLRNPTTGQTSRTWRLAGKLDAVVRDMRDGRTLLVEHKTSSEDVGPGSDYWKRLRMDGQVSVYFEGANALGYEVDGCLYDVLSKPGLRPAKATPPDARKYRKDGALYAGQREADETSEEYRARLVEAIASEPHRYYQRGEVVRLEGEVDEALSDVWQLGQQLREAELTGRAPRNPDACLRYGRTCAFFGVCSGEASLDDATRFTRSDVVHPELQHP
ncbi:PD-(D/E)XK nuclease family protein [Myxococcus eversor]|uniref:PD-(D/E)XK nuclease family protein n=1 Tax=Myxococcus eversor TaxID=2709661 RepID=UPI0013D48A1E|nr:PD-(D/E)XK nuclease family protein [Myxococcus eversor]